MESRKAREEFTEGLHGVLSESGIIKGDVLEAIKDMNKIKKGFADVTLDYDRVLSALEKINNEYLDKSEKISELSRFRLHGL